MKSDKDFDINDYVVGHSQFGTDLCAVFGLNDKIVRSIELRVQGDDFVTVTVTSLVEKSQSEALLQLIDQYRLIKKESPL